MVIWLNVILLSVILVLVIILNVIQRSVKHFTGIQLLVIIINVIQIIHLIGITLIVINSFIQAFEGHS